MLENNTPKASIESRIPDAAIEYLSADPIFEYYLLEGGLVSLYLGAFDNETQAGIAAGTLQNGHTYYDLGIGDFKIYHNNQWRIRGEGGGVASEFCPNYTPVFVDVDTFKINDFHLGLLFSVGRRLRIIEGSVSKYGVINNVTENGVLPGAIDTTIDVTMEGGESITNQLTNVCITPSATNWVPIAGNESAGKSINAIRAGVHNAQNVVIAVGDLGLLMRSTDAGASFSAVVSGTTKNLNDVAYDYTNEVFMVVGNDGVILFSSDGGVTWSASPTNPTPQEDGKHNIACAYGPPDGLVVIQMSTPGNPGNRACATIDWGANWGTSLGTINRTTGLDYSASADRWLSSSDGAANQAVSNNPDFSWTSVSVGANRFMDCCYINEAQGAVLVGVGGEIYRTLDIQGDAGWTIAGTPSFGLTDILGVDAADSSDLIHPMVVAVGRSGKIGYSMDGGSTWTQATNGFSPADDINCVHFDQYSKVFIAGSANGVICRSTNGVT